LKYLGGCFTLVLPKLTDFVFYTIYFKHSHKYKSHSVKSGECDGPKPCLNRQQCLVTLAVGNKGVALRIIGFVASKLISQSFGGYHVSSQADC
jgi:hypothetical protein